MKWCCSQLGSVFSLELAQLRNSLTQMCSEVRLLVMLGQDGSVHLEDGRDEGERLRGTRSRCHTSLNARWHFEWLASLRQVVFLVLMYTVSPSRTFYGYMLLLFFLREHLKELESLFVTEVSSGECVTQRRKRHRYL